MAASQSFLQSVVDLVDRTTYTFSSQNLGVAAASRRIVVGIGGRIASGTLTVDSVTIGGVTATILTPQASNTTSGTTTVALAIADVPTGTTGDIVVVFNTACLRCIVHAYRVVDIDSATPSDSDSSVASNPTCNLDIPAGGIAIGFAAVGNASATWTWTGLTEREDAVAGGGEAFGASSASDDFATLQTGRAITADSTTTTTTAGVFASWGPAGGANPKGPLSNPFAGPFGGAI